MSQQCNMTSGQQMAKARQRGLLAGRKLAEDGTPVTCHGGTGLEVFSFLHAAAEGHSLARAEQYERLVRERAV